MRLVICTIYSAFVCYVYFKAPGKNVAVGEVKGESTSANICYDRFRNLIETSCDCHTLARDYSRFLLIIR